MKKDELQTQILNDLKTELKYGNKIKLVLMQKQQKTKLNYVIK